MREWMEDENRTLSDTETAEYNLIAHEAEQMIPAGQLATVVQQILAPVMEQIGGILEKTNQAMERIAATQQMMSSRISELEKQVRLKTPFSRTQEKCANDAIRQRARELLDPKGYAEDRRTVTKLAGTIRKSVLTRYGISSLREAPAYDYETVLKQVAIWNDLLTVRSIVREAREKEAGEHAEASGNA